MFKNNFLFGMFLEFLGSFKLHSRLFTLTWMFTACVVFDIIIFYLLTYWHAKISVITCNTKHKLLLKVIRENRKSESREPGLERGTLFMDADFSFPRR